MSIAKVFADGVLLDPSEYTLTTTGHLILHKATKVHGSISIQYEEDDAPWKYGDMGRSGGTDFMYVASDPGRQWHEVVFITGFIISTGTIPDKNLIDCQRIEA